MKLRSSGCSVVLIGAWNEAIFTPGWVNQAIQPKEKQLEFKLGLGSAGLTLEFSFERAQMTVQRGRLSIAPVGEFDHDSDPWPALQSMADVATKVLLRLPETPVSAFGVNVGFEGDKGSVRSGILGVPESKDLAGAGLSLENDGVVRALTIENDSATLNVKLLAVGERIQVDVNHHWIVRKASEALAHLDMRSLLERSETVRRIYQVGHK